MSRTRSSRSPHAKSSAGDHPFPVINPSQLGGIETSVLDDGPGRGVRIAWVNTGGGLRYKVVIDRGLDIADAEFKGQSLTWHSLTGVTAPSRAVERGLDWLRSFYGGLVVSCGPLSAGAPCTDQDKTLSLHGTHSNTPASIEFITSPDPARGRYEMNITGVVRTARVFGPNVELRRTISSTLGVPSIRIYDQFLNRGNQPVEQATASGDRVVHADHAPRLGRCELAQRALLPICEIEFRFHLVAGKLAARRGGASPTKRAQPP